MLAITKVVNICVPCGTHQSILFKLLVNCFASLLIMLACRDKIYISSNYKTCLLIHDFEYENVARKQCIYIHIYTYILYIYIYIYIYYIYI